MSIRINLILPDSRRGPSVFYLFINSFIIVPLFKTTFLILLIYLSISLDIYLAVIWFHGFPDILFHLANAKCE